MIVKCPNCLNQYKINTSRVSKTMVRVQCPACKKSIVLNLKKAAPQEPAPASTADPIENAVSLQAKDVLSESSVRRLGDLMVTVDGKEQQPSVLIADEPRAFRDFLKRTLEELGCVVEVVDDGDAVQRHLQKGPKPHLIFLNVVLRHVMGFVLCEKIKSNHEMDGVKVVLIGAIFRLDRFRRDPSNLYGADDYIEEIIVKQELQNRVRKLLGIPNADDTGKLEQTTPADVLEHARRLARIILSDIIIYNQDKVDQAVRKETFYEELGDEIREGEEYYLSKIPSDRAEIKEIYSQTMSEFVKRRKRELLEMTGK
ncbi:MAG: hypothetical protein C5B54_12505 [Acidobacteria bacterium]|nr:MAG: hypothetical protein C5B54_12505 [Acidobacteriota bacterium]